MGTWRRQNLREQYASDHAPSQVQLHITLALTLAHGVSMQMRRCTTLMPDAVRLECRASIHQESKGHLLARAVSTASLMSNLYLQRLTSAPVTRSGAASRSSKHSSFTTAMISAQTPHCGQPSSRAITRCVLRTELTIVSRSSGLSERMLITCM